jgi:Zn-dependent protease
MRIQQYIPFISYVVFITSVILHEISHGITAYLCGDTTAMDAGRLSLSPVRHFDVVGSMIVPLLLFLTGSTIFGWAKPVPVNFDNLKLKNKVIVSCAGVFTNMILSGAGLLLYYKTNQYMEPGAPMLIQILCVGVFLFFPVNIFLAIFNALPLPPFDGWMMISSCLKKDIDKHIANRPWIIWLSIITAVVILKLISTHLLHFVRYASQLPLS